jgi:hypothetical protein
LSERLLPLPRQYACRRGYIAMDIAHDVRLTSVVSFFE